jgi:uncharacterized SAM-binding protein YcdF (DUF218 family)
MGSFSTSLCATRMLFLLFIYLFVPLIVSRRAQFLYQFEFCAEIMLLAPGVSVKTVFIFRKDLQNGKGTSGDLLTADKLLCSEKFL